MSGSANETDAHCQLAMAMQFCLGIPASLLTATKQRINAAKIENWKLKTLQNLFSDYYCLVSRKKTKEDCSYRCRALSGVCVCGAHRRMLCAQWCYWILLFSIFKWNGSFLLIHLMTRIRSKPLPQISTMHSDRKAFIDVCLLLSLKLIWKPAIDATRTSCNFSKRIFMIKCIKRHTHTLRLSHSKLQHAYFFLRQQREQKKSTAHLSDCKWNFLLYLQ